MFDTITTVDELADRFNNSDYCFDLDVDMAKRIVDIAQRRAQTRNEDGALDSERQECLIATDWVSFAADEFGYDSGQLNEFAMGLYDTERSDGSDADLFTDTIVIQHGWLLSGDGRKTEFERYNDEDFEQSDVGEFWVAHSAQPYMEIAALDPTLVHDQPGVEEAM